MLPATTPGGAGAAIGGAGAGRGAAIGAGAGAGAAGAVIIGAGIFSSLLQGARRTTADRTVRVLPIVSFFIVLYSLCALLIPSFALPKKGLAPLLHHPDCSFLNFHVVTR